MNDNKVSGLILKGYRCHTYIYTNYNNLSLPLRGEKEKDKIYKVRKYIWKKIYISRNYK